MSEAVVDGGIDALPAPVQGWLSGGPAPAGAVFWPAELPSVALPLVFGALCLLLGLGAAAGVIGEMLAGGKDPERLIFGPPFAIVTATLGAAGLRAAARARAARHAVEDQTWRAGVLVLDEGALLHLGGQPRWLPRAQVRGRRLRSDPGGGASTPHPELLVELVPGRSSAIALPSANLAEALAAWAGGAPMARPG
ncbi:MAG: hypothetical protein JNM72_12455 [Deltaproteobacteria bacterium]|jgi:hypothetical protein|nr:hypothetical protein [Deltaproteobacteria bacterium]